MYFDKVVGTLSNISDMKKKSDEINVSQNEERTECQNIERQLDNETVTTKFSISAVTTNSNISSIDSCTEIKSNGDNVNAFHNPIKNEATNSHCQYQHQNNHHKNEINATNEEIPVSPSSLTGQSSSFSHLNTSSPMSYGDEMNSIPVTSSIDDLLSLDQYDQDDSILKDFSSQNQYSIDRATNSSLERWLSQSELLRCNTRVKISVIVFVEICGFFEKLSFWTTSYRSSLLLQDVSSDSLTRTTMKSHGSKNTNKQEPSTGVANVHRHFRITGSNELTLQSAVQAICC
ncbi:unnamed protein product [Schistosoma margrebowiei]|uniref:Uncharacterized protein n=1 Tax=Schistosoma margrebowiei TaxID=48269 RepID=A0A183MR74_9TREM|nr:unnamed protein product [Schistosoma margrebowiei]